MPITLSIRTKNIKESEEDQIFGYLNQYKDYSFTTIGIMVNVFGFDLSTIKGKRFNAWPKKQQNLYNRISRTLKRMSKNGKIKSNTFKNSSVYGI